MNIVLSEKENRNGHIAGNKAARLAALKKAGFNVPAFFVVSATDMAKVGSCPAMQRELELAASNICRDGGLVAVRSSSPEEDGADMSFAGQFDSYLDIEPRDIPHFAIKVMKSANSIHIDSYRSSLGARKDRVAPAVLVQRMINAVSAGVAFAADPITGDTETAVVAATSGTGESLVSGERQGDTWRVNGRGRITASELEGRVAVLRKKQVRQVAKLVRDVSAWFGKPQDIEWAVEGRKLWLLQSRDITTLSGSASAASYALWDNSNIVESYGGVTTPLTFSVARSAYQEAYRHMGRALGVSERAIKQNERAYEQMIGLIQGRVYYNLLNWYRLLMLTPGFRFNRRFMEQMMGVTEGLPADAVPKPEDKHRFAGIRASIGIVRVAGRLVSKLFVHNSRVRRFHREIDVILRPDDLQKKSLDQLIDAYEALQSRVIPAWDTPLINDLYCMIFHGALRQLGERWLGDDLVDIHNDLVSGESGIISVEPVRRMKKLAALAAADEPFVAALCDEPVAKIQKHLQAKTKFAAEYADYLEHFGDRCLDELKLESETLGDDPLPLLRAVGQLARSGAYLADSGSTDRLRVSAELKIARNFRGQAFRARIYGLVLGLARSRVRDRENLRFERTRVYGRVRAIFVEIARRLVSLGVINEVDDIFYLDVAEITGVIRGTGISCRVSEIVGSRRREFKSFAADDDPPRRFITNGPAQLLSSMQELQSTNTELSDSLRSGQACSQGIVRGPVRIVRDPRNTDFTHGEILVAQRTDPGWVTIFPLVGGMIMERGSLLSHSAIVARELGIPAVVGVENACSWLEDGDWVELNGATGMIRRIDDAERAA